MHRLAGLLALMALMVWSSLAPAQDAYPSRTVRIVVPAAAGSTTDILARVLADQLGRKWGKTVVVENIAGGGLNIGAANVARSAPDGYSLMVAPPLPITYSHLLYRNPGYDPREFVRITLLAKIPNVMVVRKDLPAATLKDFIDYGKQNPGKLTYASGGVGSTAHLTGLQLELQTGVKMVHVTYRGAQPALSDIIAGRVDVFFDTLATSVPLYRDNKVRLLMVGDTKRVDAVPEIPTPAEAGLPGFKSVTWFGLVAPPATPAPLAEKINRDVVELLKSKEVGDLLRNISLEVGATSLADTNTFFAEEFTRWSKVIKDVGLQPQ